MRCLNRKKRSVVQTMKDFFFFPLRAVWLFEEDRYGLSSLASERFYYVAGQVKGVCLDIGCGRNNRFIREFLDGQGIGIDVYPYEGLTEKDIVQDMTRLPWEESRFDTVTFIANINHIPRSIRQAEIVEACRILKPGGNMVVTMGNSLAEYLVHKLVACYDALLGTRFDMDGERGMDEEEEYSLSEQEIMRLMSGAGLGLIEKHYFVTQWGLNRMYVGYKEK
jgi:SAM-dependent methyltransferase